MSKKLREALESDCAHSLEPAAKGLSNRDFTTLLGYLDPSAEAQRRQRALHLLGRLGRAEAVPAIVRVLPGLDESERCRAIKALGKLGGREALEAIVAHGRDESPQVRKFVIYALRGRPEPQAAKALARLESREPVDWLRQLAKQARRDEG